MELNLIYTDVNKKELGYLGENTNIDIDVGFSYKASNDFTLTYEQSFFDDRLVIGSLVYDELGGEIGGIINGIEKTKDDNIIMHGITWRGLLKSQVIEPPKGQAYYYVREDANVFLANVIDNYCDGLLVASKELCGVNVNYDIRYLNKLLAIETALSNVGLYLSIDFDVKKQKAVASAKPIVVHEFTEVSNDYGLELATKNIKNGYNHVIAMGKGELLDREIKHVYKLKNGTYTQDKQTAINDGIVGLNDRCMTYDFSSCESTAELIEGAKNKLLENSDVETLDVANINDIELFSIVKVRERITGYQNQSQITQLIYKGYVDNVTKDYTLGG